jgi:hypothetical protein
MILAPIFLTIAICKICLAKFFSGLCCYLHIDFCAVISLQIRINFDDSVFRHHTSVIAHSASCTCHARGLACRGLGIVDSTRVLIRRGSTISITSSSSTMSATSTITSQAPHNYRPCPRHDLRPHRRSR